MQHLQDKEFVGHKIPNRVRTLKSVKTRPLMRWRRSQWDETRIKNLQCTHSMHTMYRSLLDQINWLQSMTQFQCCYKICRCDSMADSPTISDVKSLNQLAKQIKSQPVKLQYCPLTGPLRILGFLDASYRNYDDGWLFKEKHDSVLRRIA